MGFRPATRQMEGGLGAIVSFEVDGDLAGPGSRSGEDGVVRGRCNLAALHGRLPSCPRPHSARKPSSHPSFGTPEMTRGASTLSPPLPPHTLN